MKLILNYETIIHNDLYLTKGKIYDGELIFVRAYTEIETGLVAIYDQQTMKPENFYRVKCDDDRFRVFVSNKFLTLEEWREKQLSKII